MDGRWMDGWVVRGLTNVWMRAGSPLCPGRPGAPGPLVTGSWLGVGAGLRPGCRPGLSLAFPPGTSGQTGQVGFHISRSLPHPSGDCVCASLFACLYVRLCLCACMSTCRMCHSACAVLSSSMCGSACVSVCASNGPGRRGGPCGFEPRELVSRQWLWQPARPTIPESGRDADTTHLICWFSGGCGRRGP